MHRHGFLVLARFGGVGRRGGKNEGKSDRDAASLSGSDAMAVPFFASWAKALLRRRGETRAPAHEFDHNSVSEYKASAGVKRAAKALS